MNYNKKQIIVIGAGAAGAMAANTLIRNGHEVTILEARNRVGGRIHTNLDWGIPLELGANWISYASSKGNLGWEYKNSLNIKTNTTSNFMVQLFKDNGSRINNIRARVINLLFEWKMKKFLSKSKADSFDISWEQAANEMTNYQNLSARKKAEIDILKKGNAALTGTSNHIASAKAYIGLYVNEKEHEELVLNGYDQLIHHLLEGSDVRLQHRVLEVENVSYGVKVTTNNGILEGDFAIITVPLSLLRQDNIKILPKMPSFKKEALHKMGISVFNKVFMEFSSKFWKGDPHFMVFGEKILKESGVVLSLNPHVKRPILVAFHVGDNGEWIERQDDQKVMSLWQSILHKSFPNKTIEFKNFKKTSWNAEPYSLGSYSHIPLGTVEADMKRIVEPHGKILFAGEGTNFKWHGYVHGALESGVREAKRIINA